MGRWLAGKLMKELGLVSYQQPTHRYKRGGHEHIVIPNRLERQFAVTALAHRDWTRFVEIEIGLYSNRFEVIREGANKRGNSSRLTQSFHFFMFEPIFSPVNALNQPI
ncbi:hypothetical protein CIFRMM251M_25810 [Citrobacter freundii]